MKLTKLFQRAACAVAAALCGAAIAQDYPSRPITIVLPVTAGSSIDAVTRSIADVLSKRLGQPVVIDNKPGAAGNLGASIVARAPADGYTLLVTTSNLAMAPSLMKSIPWNPKTAFVPIAGMFSGAMSVAVGAHVPAKNMAELVNIAKQQPGKLNYATPGNGSPHHFGTELLMSGTGMQLLHVPFRGTSPAIVDVIGGRIDVAYFSLGNLLEHHRNGKLRIIATSTDQRLPQTPDVPTLRELGLKNAEVNVWAGMFAPAGTPAAVVARLGEEMSAAMKSPRVVSVMESQHVVPMVPGTAQHLAAEYAADLEKWPAIAARIGIKAD